MKTHDAPASPLTDVAREGSHKQDQPRKPARKDGGRERWHTPRDPRATPWFGPLGWRDFATFHIGLRKRRIAAQAHAVDLALDDAALAPEQMPHALAQLRQQMRRRDTGQAMIAEQLIGCMQVLATVAHRTVGLRPSIPQLVSTLAMAGGNLVQLAPGEGKTLSVAMAAVWFAWSAKPCHVVTSNDYLAQRDADLMRPLFEACGLRVAAITDQTPSEALADIYRADVVYATAKQFLADFLRDDLLLNNARDPVRRRLWQMRSDAEARQPVMRGLHSAIIDEADGVLIDEATTPLIIAEPEQDRSGMLETIAQARELVEQLEVGRDYSLYMQGGGAVTFTPRGEARIEELSSGFGTYWKTPSRREDIFSLAVMARDVFKRDRHYIVRDGEVVIVDENTGRIMPGRSWSHGIHQSIEAREGVELTSMTRIAARMTFQEFFRHYHRLCGASGTLHGLGFELWKTFGVFTLRVAPRALSRLKVLPRCHFATRAGKLAGFVDRIIELHSDNAPILVGTRRIADSEEIALALRVRGVVCTVLNAKEHAREAEAVAGAGEFGRVTVATNMAGRGTDIMLAPGVEAAGGLRVLMFESHESPRIDWQLFGRAGRHGSQGSAQAFASFEEELVERYLPAWAKPLQWLAAPPGTAARKLALLLWLSQNHAQRIARAQRARLAFIQTQLREQLGFTRG